MTTSIAFSSRCRRMGVGGRFGYLRDQQLQRRRQLLRHSSSILDQQRRPQHEAPRRRNDSDFFSTKVPPSSTTASWSNTNNRHCHNSSSRTYATTTKETASPFSSSLFRSTAAPFNSIRNNNTISRIVMAGGPWNNQSLPSSLHQGCRRWLHLSPREINHLQLHQVGRLAQYRLARGIRLNYPETVALLTMQLMEEIRLGQKSVAELMTWGSTLLGTQQVLPGIPRLLPQVQVEATFPDGTKLLTIHNPVCQRHGDLQAALDGSFLPVPDVAVFDASQDDDVESKDSSWAPGQVKVMEGVVVLNEGREMVELTVTNEGDRPIQVGSHYAFVETNRFLSFDRQLAIGKRLNIPSGTSVRFEPGESKTVTLVSFGGTRTVLSGNQLTQGMASPERHDEIMQRVQEQGFSHKPQPSAPAGRAYVLNRSSYADMYGPTVGDIVTLGDTQLQIQVERDFTVYGDECKFGGGKTIREGMGQQTGVGADQALDVVITNALIVDAVAGVVKADIGLRGNRIVGIGKAGNPDTMDGVDMIIGNTTEVIAGEKLIVTAGGVDTHIHWICPQQIEEAASSGVTTMFGGGTGPSAGTCATTCTPSPSQVEMMLQATDGYALNFGFSGKGNTSDPAVLESVLKSGAAGFKLHEDWGTTPSAIDAALTFAEQHDVAITIHTDTLNESGFVQDSIRAMKGRTIHTYHTEGAGGGHAPDIIKIVQEPYVLPSSTNPTRPFTINTVDEHLDMLMVCHHLDSSIPEDVAFAESRIRAETIAAEDILHDMGAISMISSDSQAMGRVGEVITRTWQTADKMKQQRGRLPEDQASGNDNCRVKRYIAKYTLNPAITHGFGHLIGSVEVGKMADLVLWKPSLFGAKPEMILKGGTIAYAQMGDPNASIPTPQPVVMRPMFGATTARSNSVVFVSQAAAANSHDLMTRLGLHKPLEAVRNCRNLTKADMVWNDATPEMEVDPETFEVRANGELLTCEPVDKVALGQRFFLF
ncbi:hypothetical protein ACA910_005374 [Epithemia clementina (nom. ined.)]